MKARRITPAVDVVQWFKLGDHPAVMEIPEKYKDYLPVVRDGATGFIKNTPYSMYFVIPGDWIVHDPVDQNYAPYSAAEFAEMFELVGQPA